MGPARGDLYPMRVLLIDDGDATSTAFQRLADGAAKGTYVVDRVTTPADGFGAIAADEHDVYVVDHHVGTRTGFDLLSWVHVSGMRVPIVFVAGPGDHGTGVTAVGAGASCYVVEDSMEAGLLEHCLRHAVEQRKALSRLSSAGIATESGAATRTQLLGRIASRLREPTSGLLDVTRRALESDFPAPALEAFGAIEAKANTLLTLANDLNDLAMLESGRLQFHTVPFSLRGVIAHVRQSVGSSASARPLDLVVDVSPDVPDDVVGDPGRLRLVIVRFVETIAARSRGDRVEMRVAVEEWSAGAATVGFDLRAGVDADGEGKDRPAAGAASPAAARGALGMPIALEVVSRMGGRVTVDGDRDDAPAVQFTVFLQVGDEERAPRPTVDDEVASDGPVLVISDAADARRALGAALEDAGIAYLGAPNVEAWTRSMGSEDGDAVVPSLAVIESTVDSFAVCDEFTRVAPSIPVVIVVPSGTRGDAVRCRERGVRGYLARPMDSGDFLDVVRTSMAMVSSGDDAPLVTRHWLREGRQSLHVLVVDDSTTNRFLLTRMLENRGHSTAIARDGVEAVEAARAETFDIILMDVMMPTMDGLEATRLIREMHAGSGNQPFIVGVSAFADRDSVVRAGDAGMDGYLTKPVRLDDLVAAVEQRRPATIGTAT